MTRPWRWLASALFAASCATAAPELLSNPDLSGDDTAPAPGWSVNAWGRPGPTYRVARDAVTRAQRIEVTAIPAGAGFIYRSEFGFQRGRTYQARMRLRSPDRARVQVMLRRSGQWYEAVGVKGVTLADAWQDVILEGGFGEGDVPGFLGLFFRGPGTVLVSRASLTDISDAVLARPTPTEPVPATLFGIHLNKLGSHNVWPDLNAGLLRLWDTGTVWAALQPAVDRWDWTRLDYYVRHVQRNAPDAAIIMTLGITPQWAGPPGGKTSYSGTSAPPVDLEQWRQYVRTVGRRYQGRIRYWELWNETDFGGFYTGTPAQMVELARIAAAELRAIDAANRILSPNITRNGLGWLDEFLALGGGRYVDVVSFHRYQTGTPEDLVPEYAGVQDLARAWGLGDQPVWNTEGAIEAKPDLSEEQAIGAVARSYLVQWAQGVRNFNWYCWDIHWPGGANLSRTLTGTELTAAGIAYREVARWLVGATMTRRTVAGQTWVVDLRRPDGRPAKVAWATQGTATLPLPADWAECEQCDLRSRRQPVDGRTVPLGVAPVLVSPRR